MGYNRLREAKEMGWDISEASTDEKLEMIKSYVDEIDIVEGLTNYGVHFSKFTYSRALGLCPFHLDEKIGSFSADSSKNSCWCYSCMQGGSLIASMAKIWKKSQVDAMLQIACDYGIITTKEYAELAGSEYSNEYLEGKIVNVIKIPEKKRPTNETYDMWTAVYEYIRDYFKVSDEDREYLRNVRNLSDERIDKDYFSFTLSDPKEVSRLVMSLKIKFPEYADKLKTIPGFFEFVYERKNSGKPPIWQLGMCCSNSIGILLRNAKGQVIAIQTRDKNPNASQRYSYYSWMPGKHDKKFRAGGSVSTPLDVLWPKSTESLHVAIVEGRFKSEILTQNGCVSISVQGVNNFKGIEEDIFDIEEKTGKKVNHICVFYDADLIRNDNVYKAGCKLATYLKEKIPGIKVNFIIWPPEIGKGIDDLILGGYKSQCKAIDSERFESIRVLSYDKAVKEAGIDKKEIVKIPKEERVKFFDIFEKHNRKALNL